MRRMEDRIRTLCREIVAARDDKEQVQRLAELRRARLVEYPIVIERRQQNGIPPPNRASTETPGPSQR